jgi:hypothetical protein
MAGASETLTHPVLGSLAWMPDGPHWYTRYRLLSGVVFDVMVEPGGADRYEVIERAAKLFAWAVGNERRVLADAIEAELLGLYNGTWRRGDDAELDAGELATRLEWHLLTVNPGGVVPVEFTYGAGDLFGGHGVAVEVDQGLQFRDVDLRG